MDLLKQPPFVSGGMWPCRPHQMLLKIRRVRGDAVKFTDGKSLSDIKQIRRIFRSQERL